MKKSAFWKTLFHTDIFMFAFAVVFVWFTVTLLYDEFTTFQSLRKHAGVIKRSEFVITKIKNKPLFKDTTREMRLFLDNDPGYYSITMSKTLPEFDNLFWGDSVNLYTKDKWLRIFGFSESRIVHLERVSDQKVFLDYEKEQKSKRGIYLLTGFTAIILFWLYFRKTRRRLAREQS